MRDQGPVQSSSVLRFPEWQSEYEAAVRETDISKLFKCVEVAESALHKRLEVLEGSSDHGAERSAIAAALAFLKVIKREKLHFGSQEG
jgi:hypothetical protein